MNLLSNILTLNNFIITECFMSSYYNNAKLYTEELGFVSFFWVVLCYYPWMRLSYRVLEWKPVSFSVVWKYGSPNCTLLLKIKQIYKLTPYSEKNLSPPILTKQTYTSNRFSSPKHLRRTLLAIFIDMKKMQINDKPDLSFWLYYMKMMEESSLVSVTIYLWNHLAIKGFLVNLMWIWF